MKIKTFILFFFLLNVLTFFGLGQNVIKDINDLKFIPENTLPDVNGKLLISKDFVNQLFSKGTKDSIEVFPGWPIIENGSSQRGGIYCNLDQDPDLEIVYCIGQQVYAWKTDGSVVTGWPQPLQLYPNGAPAFGDVDGDGEGEIVVSTATPGTGAQGRIFVFEKDGTPTTGFPVILGGGATKTPVLADLDGDYVLEIIIEERSYPEGFVAVYDGDGNTFPGFPVAMDYIPGSAVAVGDITGDNIPEIVAESYYSVYAYDINGNVLDGFPYTPGNDRVFSYSSPVLADLDGDGLREIIVGDHSLSTGNGAVHVIKNDGLVFPGWPKYTANWIYGPAAVGDIDGNGSLDIAIGDQVLSGTPATKVYVWDKDGNNLSGWPSDFVWSINNQILLADLDGDNLIELIWDDNTNDGKYLGYNHDGTVMEGWPLPVQWSTFFMNPFVADVNNDGVTDLSGGGIDISGDYDCAIYLWDTDADFNPDKNVLPVLQYNVRHDGVYMDPDILNANFTANPIELCEQEETQFTDQSAGNVISWEWTFTGGYPDSSTEQNPIIWYGTAGEYDVTLTVSDGNNTHTTTKTNYIKVQIQALVPQKPVGNDTINNPPTNVSYYETLSDNADSYIWELIPESAGLILPGDTINEIKIYWSQENSLIADLKVKAVNVCGESDFSEHLAIYLNWSTDIKTTSENQDFKIFPNPINTSTTVEIKMSNASFVRLFVIDFDGNKVQTLISQKLSVGNHQIEWNAEGLSAGIYFVRMETNSTTVSRKLLLTR